MVMSDTTGIRVASDRTSSNGSLAPFSGVPQLPQWLAPRSNWRRQVRHSTA
jgi:hypothetical protein